MNSEELQHDKLGYSYSYADKVPLPEGVEHGSMRAVRLGCHCKACLARKKKAARRGVRVI